jgi:hypothetical protein
VLDPPSLADPGITWLPRLRAVLPLHTVRCSSQIVYWQGIHTDIMTAVIAQMFEWNYASVQTECPTLANAGYTYVQVSPPAEHITGPQWWASYQRVSSQLVSRHGNRAQFASMISACNNAGVQVIVDVVINHMTSGSGTGTGGTRKFILGIDLCVMLTRFSLYAV